MQGSPHPWSSGRPRGSRPPLSADSMCSEFPPPAFALALTSFRPWLTCMSPSQGDRPWPSYSSRTPVPRTFCATPYFIFLRTASDHTIRCFMLSVSSFQTELHAGGLVSFRSRLYIRSAYSSAWCEALCRRRPGLPGRRTGPGSLHPMLLVGK